MLTQHFLCTHTSIAGLLPGWRQSLLWEPRYTQPHNFYLTLQLLCSYIGPPAAQSKYPEADLVASWGILLQIQWLRKNTHWNEWQWTYIPDGKWCWCLHHGSGLFPLLKSIIMQLFETYSYWTQARRALSSLQSWGRPLRKRPASPVFFRPQQFCCFFLYNTENSHCQAASCRMLKPANAFYPGCGSELD